MFIATKDRIVHKALLKINAAHVTIKAEHSKLGEWAKKEGQRQRERVTKPGLAGNANQST